MSSVVDKRFRITIDKRARDALGIKPGDLAVEHVENGRLIVRFVSDPRGRSLLGILHRPGMKPITDWRAAKERAWAARSAEIMEALREDSARHRSEGL